MSALMTEYGIRLLSVESGKLILLPLIDGVLQSSGSSHEIYLSSLLFIGGVSSFSLLPDQVMQTGGFVGCIRDLQINGQTVAIVLDALYGFNIEQCLEPVCSYVECQNGATCIDTSVLPGFMCECADGYSGQFCEAPVPLCEPNPCLFGGICSQFGATYSCQCPLERGGRNCEQELNITYPMFSGNSYLAYMPLRRDDPESPYEITVTFFLYESNGLLLFTSLADNEFSDHLSISIIERRVHYRYSFGGNQTSITSSTQLDLQVWHTVTISLQDRTSGTLSINDEETMLSYFNTLNVNTNLWLGGFNTFMDISSITGVSQGLNGCVTFLSVNGRSLDLILDAEFGYAISECNSSSCDGNPCFNNGVCTETGSSFVCECTSGYIGPLCATLEDPCVLGAQQCSSGSTCVTSFDGLSFMCLCPLGRAGDLCEQDITVTTPMFNLTSYLRYPVLFTNTRQLTLSLSFNPSQHSGLLFHSGDHTQRSDFISISLMNQRVEIRYDLGAGIAMIVSDVITLNDWHTVIISRNGRQAVASVDGETVCMDGRCAHESPGTLERLDVAGDFSVGGVRDYRVVSPLAGTEVGFSGCIGDVMINGVSVDLIGQATEGRDITECILESCASNPCANGGTCLMESSGVSCVCPLGFQGDTCQEAATSISVPFFNGQSSYLAYPTLRNSFAITYLRLEVRPMQSNGLILFNGYTKGPDFIAILLREGRVEFWYDLGLGAARIISNSTLILREWHSIEVSRTAQNGHMIIDDQLPVTGSSPGNHNTLQLNTDLLLGGSPDFNSIPEELNIMTGFSGCIRALQIQFTNGFVDLISDATSGASITQCPGLSPCDTISCQNGGVCIEIENGTRAVCECTAEFTGEFCETETCSASNPCQNNGVCYVSIGEGGVREAACNCSLPFGGETCTERATFDQVFISPNGFLQYGIESISDRRLSVSSAVEITFSPSSLFGLLFFMGATADEQRADYILIGLQDGFVEYRFDLGSGAASVLSSQRLQLGVNYTIYVDRVDNEGVLRVSGQSEVSVTGDSSTSSLNLFNDERFVVYLGGEPPSTSGATVQRELRRYTGFTGHIFSVSIGRVSSLTPLQLDSAQTGQFVT